MDMISVNVKTMDASTFTLDIAGDLKVAALKKLITKEKGYVESRQRLIFRGKVLKDMNNIEYYKITGGHTILLVLRSVGDPSNPDNDNPETIQAQESRSTATSSSVFGGDLQRFMTPLRVVARIHAMPITTPNMRELASSNNFSSNYANIPTYNASQRRRSSSQEEMETKEDETGNSLTTNRSIRRDIRRCTIRPLYRRNVCRRQPYSRNSWNQNIQSVKESLSRFDDSYDTLRSSLKSTCTDCSKNVDTKLDPNINAQDSFEPPEVRNTDTSTTTTTSSSLTTSPGRQSFAAVIDSIGDRLNQMHSLLRPIADYFRPTHSSSESKEDEICCESIETAFAETSKLCNVTHKLLQHVRNNESSNKSGNTHISNVESNRRCNSPGERIVWGLRRTFRFAFGLPRSTSSASYAVNRMLQPPSSSNEDSESYERISQNRGTRNKRRRSSRNTNSDEKASPSKRQKK